MAFRPPRPAPESRVPDDRRGPVIGRYCLGCNSTFPPQRSRHSGDPIIGRDHVASPCAYEGSEFGPGADWWEPAVEVLPVETDGGSTGKETA